jgi:type II secretory ATPase GspE/PulE/Tfp pilus assembly ATPase PilB-like protein
MTGAYKVLHDREAAFLKTLTALSALNEREALKVRMDYLRSQTHESLLSLLRERGFLEDTLRTALLKMGVPDGGPGETPDPLHPLVLDQNLPYINPAEETNGVQAMPSMQFERLSDALDSLGVPLEDDQWDMPDLEKILLKQGLINDEILTKAHAIHKGMMYVDLRRSPPDVSLKNELSDNIINTQLAIPYAIENGELLVAINNPHNIFIRNNIEDQIGRRPRMVLAQKAQIKAYIDATYERDRAVDALREESVAREETRRNRRSEDQADVPDESNAVTHFVETMIREASGQHASDIHIQPTHGDTEVRFRIDGEVTEYKKFPKNMHRAITNRIRAMGSLNTSGDRKPQDAIIRYDVHNLKFNLRCNIVPSNYGSKVALRLARPPESIANLADTDLSDANLAAAMWALKQPNGMIVLSGPTGSGKTVFSHTLIKHINTPNITIFTIENPIEIEMPGLNQIQINPEVPNEEMRTDYPDILRALLRQDPDVIMIGEVRDLITARTAVQAAQTGHLMITTIHSNSAAGVITRLLDMGIETFNLSSSLRLLIAQRLAGRPCPDCRYEMPTPDGLFDAIGGGPDNIIETNGKLGGSQEPGMPICQTCKGKGIVGRIGIHEMIRVTPNVEKAIRERNSERDIERIARKDGFRPLWEDALMKLKDGQTTLRLIAGVTEGSSDEEYEFVEVPGRPLSQS